MNVLRESQSRRQVKCSGKELKSLKECLTMTAKAFAGMRQQHRRALLEQMRRLSGQWLWQSEFDYISARKIREANDLSQKRLAVLIGINFISIYRFESGVLIPDPRCRSSRRYVTWLVEHGFKTPENCNKRTPQ